MTEPHCGGALVTGAAKRVGRALCLELAKAGYAVAVHHRGDAQDASSLVTEITAAGGRAIAVKADLSTPNEVRGLFDEALSGVGELSLLINNASYFGEDTLQTLTQDTWQAHMGPNLFAPILLVQAFAAAAANLAPGADPSVINILDQRVLRPNPQFFSYTLSKAALYSATTTMAQALAPHVRVNGIGPGPTLPSIHQSQETFQAEVDGLLLKRQTSVSDITRAALYLARSPAVTGQMIAVDGGQHLAWETPDIIAG